jgi:sec-independent protein translocase protein TatC
MNDEGQFTLIEHLTELRYRLVKALQGLFVGMGLCLYFSEELLTVIRRPILPFLGANGGLIFTGVMDKFMAHIKVGALAGLILTCPYWLYHVWKFVSPGLYKNERKYAVIFIVAGTLLFLMGVAFVYFLVFPAAFEYLFSIGGTTDKPMITIDDYLGFFALMTVLFGVAFEMPLILILLAMIGVFDAEFLKKNRRIAIVAMAVVAAVLSPPDALSMVAMWIPLLIFYESSIWIIHFFVRKRAIATTTELSSL